jgi:plastocyanin
MRRVILLAGLIALLCASVALARTTRTVSATESDGLGYSDESLRASPGKVTLKMRNPSSLHLRHSISIRGNGVSKKGPVVKPGGTSVVSAKLKKGTYTFFCHVKGHEKEGMKGTLKVG